MHSDRSDRATLRAARAARGWSQAEAARELAALGRARGSTVAAAPSLKTLLSRWENGHAVPEPQYRALLAELYGQSATELGLDMSGAVDAGAVCTAGTDRLRARLAAAAEVDDDVLALWREQLGLARRLDDRLGAAGAAELVGAQVDELDRALVHTLAPARRAALAEVLAEAAVLAGWQALDQGDPEGAWRRYERGRTAAREAAAPGAVAEAIAGQAAVLVDIGEPRSAAALLEGAPSTDAPAANVRLAAALGTVRAAAGEAMKSRQAFDTAERVLRERLPDLAWPAVVIELADLHRWRGHALVTLHDPGALGPLEQALRAGPPSVRDRALLHADLAVTLVAAGRAEDAADHARTARELARRIGSARVTERLDGTGQPGPAASISSSAAR